VSLKDRKRERERPIQYHCVMFICVKYILFLKNKSKRFSSLSLVVSVKRGFDDDEI